MAVIERREAENGENRHDLTKAEYETLADFRYQLRRFRNFSQSAARAGGLTSRQHQALLSIIGQPGRDVVTIGELADHLLIRHHSAVELTDRLVTLGLVHRDHDLDDKRKVRISLTPRARKLLARMSAMHLEELHRLGPQLAELLARFGT